MSKGSKKSGLGTWTKQKLRPYTKDDAARLSVLAKTASEEAQKYDTAGHHDIAGRAHAKAAEAHGAVGDREQQNDHAGKSRGHVARAQQLRDAHGRFTK